MTRASASLRSSEGGFTLLETLIVLAIITVGVTIAVPITGRTRDAVRLRTSADMLAADLRDVRAAAIASGTPRALAIVVAERRTFADGVVPHRALSGAVRVVTATGSHSTGTTVVHFRPDGSTDPVRVDLAGATGTVSVVVPGATGVARVVVP